MNITVLTPEEEFDLLKKNRGKEIKIYFYNGHNSKRSLYSAIGILKKIHPYSAVFLSGYRYELCLPFIGLNKGIKAIFNEQNKMIYNNLQLPHDHLDEAHGLFVANKEREKKWGSGHELLPEWSLFGKFSLLVYERLLLGKETSSQHIRRLYKEAMKQKDFSPKK